MNNSLRKILSCILAAVTTLSFANAYAKVTDRNEKPAEETYTAETYGYNSGLFLKKIGVIEDIGVLENEISRGEFCRVLYETIFSDTAFSQSKRFNDVDENTENSDYINTIAEYGYINGYNDNCFRPDNVIASSEASAIYVRILGYDIPSNPASYEQITAQLGLLNGIKSASNKAMTWADCYMMMQNALKTDVMVYDDNNNSYRKINETLLEYKLNIYECRGIVTDDGQTALKQESTIGSDSIIIDNLQYTKGSASVDGLLGCYVKGYYKWDRDNDEKTLLYADIDEAKTKFKRLDRSDIDEFSLTEIKYTEKGRTKNIKISADADYIYNGVAAGSLNNEIIKNFTLGDVKLIDSDGDNVYDVLFINSYKTMVVSSVAKKDEKILGKYNEQESLTGFGEDEIKTYREDKEIKWTELHDFDVIKILENKNSWTAWVVNKSYYGKVEFIKSEGDSTKYVLEGKEYTLAREYKNSAAAKPETGSTGMFYFTEQNQIAYFEDDKAETIGYLHKIFTSEPFDGYLDPVIVEVFSTDNKWNRLVAADKIQINGKTVKKEDIYKEPLVYSNGATVRNPIKYALNKEGEIVKLWVPDQSCPDDDTLQPAYAKNTTIRYCDGGVLLNPEAVSLMIGYSGSAINFRIPSDPNNKDLYYASKGISARNDEVLDNVEAYYTSYASKKIHQLDIVVQIENSGIAKSDTGNRPSVVKSIVTAVDEDNEVCEKLTVVRRGKEYSYFTQPGKKINGIKPGDVVRVYWDSHDKLSGYRKLYSMEEDIDATTVAYSAPKVRRNDNEIMEYAKRLWGISDFSQYSESEYYIGDFRSNSALSSPAEAAYYKSDWFYVSCLRGNVKTVGKYGLQTMYMIQNDYENFVCKVNGGGMANYYMTGVQVIRKTGSGALVESGSASDVVEGDKVVVAVDYGNLMEIFVYKDN